MSAEADFAAVVEKVMAAEGWVCNPADHDGIPLPGECINCDAERHRTGYRLHAAILASDWLAARESAAATRARAEGAAGALRDAATRIDQKRRETPDAVGVEAAPEVAGWLRRRAASIARSDAAPHTGDRPVDWDSPTWGGGVHHATTDETEQ